MFDYQFVNLKRFLEMKKFGYRERIYPKYGTSLKKSQAPLNISGLKPRSSFMKHIIFQFFPKDRKSKILDLGCGYGALIYFAKELGYTDIIGIDGSPEQIEASRSLGIDNVELGDLKVYLESIEESTLDCIITFDVLEHFSKDELQPIIDDIYRVLKQGGNWIIHTINAESPFFGRIRYGDYTHEMSFTKNSISQILISSGFEQVNCYEDKPIPHGIKSTIRSFLWKGIHILLQIYILIETGSKEDDLIFTQNFLTVCYK